VYVGRDKRLLFFKENAFFAACAVQASADITIWQLERSHPTENRIYVVYVSDGYLIILWLDLAKNTCTEGFAFQDQYKNYVTYNKSLGFVIHAPQAVWPIADRLVFTNMQLFRGLLEYFKYQASTNESAYPDFRPVAYIEELIDVDGSRPGNNTYTFSVDQLKFCHKILTPSDLKATNVTLTLCLGYLKETQTNPSKLIVIDHNSHSVKTFFGYFETQIPASFSSNLLHFSCAFQTATRISCLTLDASSQAYQFYLERTQEQCFSQSAFCVKVMEPPIFLEKESKLSVFNLLHNRKWTVLVALKKDGPFVLNDLVLLVFESGKNFAFSSLEYGKITSTETVTCGFLGQDLNKIFIFDSNLMVLSSYEISDIQVKFTAPKLTEMSGILNFSNHNPESPQQYLDLKTIFLPETNLTNSAVVQPKNQTFLQRFKFALIGLVILAAVAAVVAYYWMKRKRLREQQARMNEDALHSLEEFYYHPRK